MNHPKTGMRPVQRGISEPHYHLMKALTACAVTVVARLCPHARPARRPRARPAARVVDSGATLPRRDRSPAQMAVSGRSCNQRPRRSAPARPGLLGGRLPPSVPPAEHLGLEMVHHGLLAVKTLRER